MYYLAIIQNDEAMALYKYSDLDAVMSAFHNELAYRAEGRKKTICTILNSFGELVRTEYWERPTISDNEPGE